MKEIYFCYY